MSDPVSFITCLSVEDMAAKALQLITDAAIAAIRERGVFVFSLAGGNTPGLLYSLLAETHQDWANWILVYGDERYLPDNHSDRNSYLVEKNWLSRIEFPQNNHLTIEYSGNIEKDCICYEDKILPYLPIDFALLGLGEDGHTASLFPLQEHSNIARVVVVDNAPKAPEQRISLNYSTLNSARMVCFLVSGKGKEAALQQWRHGIDLPASRIKGKESTICLTDLSTDLATGD